MSCVSGEPDVPVHTDQLECWAARALHLVLVAVSPDRSSGGYSTVERVPVCRHTELTIHSWDLKMLLLGEML